MRRAIVLAATVVLAAAMLGPAAADNAPRTETTPVMWHPQAVAAGIGDGHVEGAHAKLRATDSGLSITFHTRDLEPGHAYTLWLVFVNNPEECANQPCTAPELFDPASGVDAQVTYGAGTIAGSSGKATFAARLDTGPVEGWLPDRELKNPRTGEHHFVVNSHGPKLAEHMPGMIRTYRGGCSDDSPVPPFFPDTALADGEPGPNTCLLYQSAVFQP